MLKLRAPPNCTAVSYLGEPLTIDSDGTLAVDEVAAQILVAHGFRSNPVSALERSTDRADPGAIAGMSRSALLSLLRSRGVSVSPPITIAALQAAARKALESANE